MEDFVPYDLAVKLRDKGFNLNCTSFYALKDFTADCVDDCGDLYEVEFTKYDLYLNYPIKYVKHKDNFLSAPTISQVLKWLRSRNIHIEPFLVNAETVQYKLNIMGWNGKFFCSIYNSLLEDANNKTITTYQSYEQAALAGIEYVLDNNLI